MAQYRVFLGTHCRLSGAITRGKVVLEPKEASKMKAVGMMESMIETRQCSSGDSAKLKGGILGWLATHSTGRIGRVGTYQLKRRQYEEKDELVLTEELCNAFCFLMVLIMWIPPKTIPMSIVMKTPLICYSDASYAPGQRPRLGWVAMEQSGEIRCAATAIVSEVVEAAWLIRDTQICSAETLAPSAA